MLKKSFIIVTGCIFLAGCSSADRNGSTSYDIAEEPAMESSTNARSSPDISPTAAPGVAFHYRYAFRVPDDKIAAVQEVHASACEVLGISRCRITGMRYRLIDEDEVEGFLAFKLDPMIARNFGKEAISSVEKAEGILADSEISGRDVGTQITASQRRSSDLGSDLKRIEARLAAKKLGDRERTELQEQAQRLRAQLSSETQTRRDGEESLANTPMEFSYSGGSVIPGLGRNPLAGALETSIRSFVTMVTFVLVAIGLLLPWLILAFLLTLLWRSKPGLRVRHWFGKQNENAKTYE